IAIVGGIGFVGTNLVLHFLKAGHKVVALDNGFKEIGGELNKRLIVSEGAEFCHLDIRSQTDVDHYFSNSPRFDAIINMAAQVAFKRSVENPRLDFEINALGTLNLLEALRRFQSTATFVYASTNQVYGALQDIELVEQETRYDFVNLPEGVPENFPLDFLSPYGCSKGAGDQYTLDYARVFNLNTVVTRFGGIYGDHQYSYEDHGWVAFMTKMVVQDLEFNRYGHGKQVRDVLYVSDIVAAIDACLERIQLVKGEAINVAGGPGQTLSVLELLAHLQELTGNTERSIVNPMRKADKLVSYLDIRKARKLLDWKPQVGVREGLEKLVAWTKQATH
ncbi:MAG: GDP-mannose 4,6-dehydratase, partial [Bdellovibrionales bacterium]|nr:GDP-mannose 4,6-dehydratase [Bdellovibrionales bacterium]